MIVTTWQADWVWMQVDYQRHFPLGALPSPARHSPFSTPVSRLESPRKGNGVILQSTVSSSNCSLDFIINSCLFKDISPSVFLCLSFLHSWVFFLCSIQASSILTWAFPTSGCFFSKLTLKHIFMSCLHFFTVLNSKQCNFCTSHCVRTLHESFSQVWKARVLFSSCPT